MICMTKDLEDVIVDAVSERVYRRVLRSLGRLLGQEAEADEDGAKGNGKTVRRPRATRGEKPSVMSETPAKEAF